jgi:hypothetical protein
MQYKSNKGYTGFGQLGILMFSIGVGLMLASVLQLIFFLPLLPKGVPMEKAADYLEGIISNPKHVSLVRWINVASALVGFFIPAIIYSRICHGTSFFWLGFSKYIHPKQLLIVVPVVFLSGLTAATLHVFSQQILEYIPALKQVANGLEQNYDKQVNIIGQMNGPTDMLLVLVLLAFLPALFEEVLFRGALQRMLERWWKWPLLAIVVASLIFSIIHISISLFLSRAWLGFILGMLYFYTRNIWVPIFAHFLNNAVAVVQLFFMKGGKHSQMPADDVMESNWWMGLIAIAILVVLFRKLKEVSESNVARIHVKENTMADSFSLQENRMASS